MFKKVICEVQYWAMVTELDRAGNITPRQHTLGKYEAKDDAERALDESGLTRKEHDLWAGEDVIGGVSRVLNECADISIH